MKIRVITETTGDLEFEEPFGYFEYAGEEYPFWGNPSGRAKTVEYDVGKFNKYAKIGESANELVAKFRRTVNREPNSIDGRCSYACLIMMQYGIRIGNEDSAMGYESGLEDNAGELVQTYGTTTLLNKHVQLKPSGIALNFLGKTQVEQHVTIDDPFVAQYAKKYHDAHLPDEKWLGIDYDILFDFVKSTVGDIFIPKDFRTFCANVTGWKSIKSYLDKPKRETRSDVNDEIKSVVESVANKLGNTPGISKRSYIDNRMLDWFKNERLKDEE
jgi:DNA topoisomerase IB